MTSKLQHKGIYLLNKNRLTDIENKFGVAKGEGGREGRTESVGLTDTNYYEKDVETTRSYCIAQGTIFSIL